MTKLGEEIARRIAREGPLPVADYMRLCLLDAEHGYYRRNAALGAAGDFITAPEISQVFGELVGLWAAAIWAAMGAPAPVRLIELGPGRGVLMADALRAVAQVARPFRDALDIHLVEINPVLRAAQEAALPDTPVTWHDEIDTIPAGPAIVIANEFFDALPVRQVLRESDGWRERAVTLHDGAFAFTASAPAAPPALPPDGVAPGDIVEISPDGERLAGALAARLAAHGGAALIIDYGPLARGAGDTLQAVRAHRKVDPLADPGEADLTAQVDFAGLAAQARAAGCVAWGPLPQGRFLQRLGAAARAATLMRAVPGDQAQSIAASVGRLIDDDQMGALFKALAITAPGLPTPPGFDAPAAQP